MSALRNIQSIPTPELFLLRRAPILHVNENTTATFSLTGSILLNPIYHGVPQAENSDATFTLSDSVLFNAVFDGTPQGEAGDADFSLSDSVLSLVVVDGTAVTENEPIASFSLTGSALFDAVKNGAGQGERSVAGFALTGSVLAL